MGINILRAQGAASRIIDEYGITSPDEIRLADIAYERGVITKADVIDGADAWLLRRGKRGLMRVNRNIREAGRKRFAGAHELGHWELHMNLSQAWLCTSDDIHAYKGSDAEIEANAFAAELLMPHALFRPRLKQGVSMALVRQLAEEFKTTLTATAVRLVQEADEDCYVVFSSNNRVQWWCRSAKASYWIEKNFAVRPSSFTYCCETPPDENSRMGRSSVDAWFPHERETDGVEVWEEAVSLSEYGVVITLLCVV